MAPAAATQAARVLVVAACLGGAEKALEISGEYTAQRHTFGKPLGKYEGISFEHHEVMAVSNELNEKGYERGVAGSGALPWHTDYSFLTTGDYLRRTSHIYSD